MVGWFRLLDRCFVAVLIVETVQAPTWLAHTMSSKLPVQRKVVTVRLQLRRWRCPNQECRRRTLADHAIARFAVIHGVLVSNITGKDIVTLVPMPTEELNEISPFACLTNP
jgi:hypothetical protein